MVYNKKRAIGVLLSVLILSALFTAAAPLATEVEIPPEPPFSAADIRALEAAGLAPDADAPYLTVLDVAHPLLGEYHTLYKTKEAFEQDEFRRLAILGMQQVLAAQNQDVRTSELDWEAIWQENVSVRQLVYHSDKRTGYPTGSF